MADRNVILTVDARSALGRGVIHGVADFAGAGGEWTLTPVGVESRVYRGSDVSPRSGDAVIGVIDPDVAALWKGEHRRFVVNVSRGRHVDGGANVTCDDEAIGRMAAEHLLSKGLEHFAFYGPAAMPRRGRAFAGRLGDAFGPVPHLNRDGDQEKLGRALCALPRPCGILAFNDIDAHQLLNRARALGLGVPRDLAVIGVDNDVMINMLAPVHLTSVAVDFERIGYEAARALDVVFRGGDPPAEPIRIPPTEVVERSSTDFPGDVDPLAVQAARAIRRQACRALTVPAMIEDLPASYRTVDRRFRRAFGRSLQSEATAVRMAAAARLLETTLLPLAAVAEQTGYSDANYFNTVFRKHVGMPPGAYRRTRAGGGASQAATGCDSRPRLSRQPG